MPELTSKRRSPEMSGSPNQKANAGLGSVIVQIKGDGNTVIVGLPHLELFQYQGLYRRINTDPITGKPNEIDIINPFARAIGMVGRETVLAGLRNWLGSNEPVSTRVLTGGAGLGKSRLSLELIEEMAAEGWRAGFLTRDNLAHFRSQPDRTCWDWNAPVLAIVDYASASAHDLNAWLRDLAGHPVWEDRGGRTCTTVARAVAGAACNPRFPVGGPKPSAGDLRRQHWRSCLIRPTP